MERANEEVRRKIERNGLRYWRIAQEVGVSAVTFTVWMREPLSADRRQRIESAIKTLRTETR